jgi:hypothetical protein
MRRLKTAKDIDFAKFDFLDFGASKAASLEYGKKHFSGKRGLGVDLNPERVKAMNKLGYDSMVGDLTDLKIPKDCVRFVKMAHILEHMPSLTGVEKAIAAAKKAATDFLVITGPFFDEDDYLKSKGLKPYWSGYKEHTCHLKVLQLIHILNQQKLDNYEIYVRYPMFDSSAEQIHPLNSPAGVHQYDPKAHPPKQKIKFDRIIWTDFVCYVRLRPQKDWKEITKGYSNQIPYMERVEGKELFWPPFILNKFIEIDAQSQQLANSASALRTQKAQLSERVNRLEKELTSIKSSKSWKLTRRFQKSSAVLKNPHLQIRKKSSE